MCYYLVNGNNPKCDIVLDTMTFAFAKKHKLFSRARIQARREVEKAFGVLFWRWSILFRLCNYHDEDVLVDGNGSMHHFTHRVGRVAQRWLLQLISPSSTKFRRQ